MDQPLCDKAAEQTLRHTMLQMEMDHVLTEAAGILEHYGTS